MLRPVRGCSPSVDAVPLPPDHPLLAVVSPPRIGHFLGLVGIDEDEPITANFSGWSKLVLLTADLAILFPRDHTQVASLEREVQGLRSVEPAALAQIPEPVGWWHDPDVSSLPFLAVTRLAGTSLEALEEELDVETLGDVLAQVGRLTARWHALPVDQAGFRAGRRSDHRQDLDQILGTSTRAPTPHEAAATICTRLGTTGPAEIRAAAAAIDRARSLEPVLVHSDVHAGQILVDPTTWELTGILDWQGVRVDHPFADFDLGEWSTAMWRRHRRDFPALRRRYWGAYAAERRLDPELADVCEWVWAVAHALSFDLIRVGGPDRTHVTGTRDEAVAIAAAATRALRL